MTDTTALREAAGNFIRAASRYLADEASGYDRNLRTVTLNAPAYSHTHRTVTLREGALQALGLMLELNQTMGVPPEAGPNPALDRIVRPEIRAMMADYIRSAGGVEIFFCLEVDASGVACRILRAIVGDEHGADVFYMPGVLTIHNHPGGVALHPSPLDILAAANLWQMGSGFAVCDNSVSRINVVTPVPRIAPDGPPAAGNTVHGVLENIFANGYGWEFDGSQLPVNGYGYNLGVTKHKTPQPATGWTLQEDGTWSKCDGTYSYGYRVYEALEGAPACIGVLLEGEAPWESANLTVYLPMTPKYSDKLDRSPVRSEGIADAWLNLALDAPSLRSQRWYDQGEGVYGWDDTTDSAPALAPVMLGVNETAPGEYEYTTLAGELSGVETADGVEREYGAAKIVKAYVDNYQKHQGFVLTMMPPDGLELGAAVGRDAMVALLWKYYGNSCQWDELGNLVSGEAWAKQITYDGLATGHGHVAFDLSKFFLHPAMRVN